MTDVRIKATVTQRYCMPGRVSEPAYFFMDGQEYIVPEDVAEMVAGCDGCDIIEEIKEDDPQKQDPENENGDGSKVDPDKSEIEPETKEGKKGFFGRKPGQKK